MALHQSHVSRPLGKQKSTTSHPMVADEPAKRRQPPSCLEVGTQQTQLTNDGRCRPAATGTDKAMIPPSTPRRPSLIRSPSKQKGLLSRRMSIDKRDGDTIPLVQWDVIPLCKSLCWDGYRRALQIHRERASLWPKGGYDVCRGPSSTVLFERQLHDRDDQRQPSITMGLLMQPAGE
ncbi:MAG: hypothetical protein M1815_000507 [Lichina confinis]|nr:MAG: hypothetical protein M1815_000507 [Lichina confinis]